MKRFILSGLLLLLLHACSVKDNEPGRFTVNGTVKNTSDQKVYLEQLFFSEKNPEVVDTADVKNGKFTLSAVAPEEGLYRLRFEKQEAGFVFINDKPVVPFSADLKDESLAGPDFKTPANHSFKMLLMNVADRSKQLMDLSSKIDSLQRLPGNDSLITVTRTEMSRENESAQAFFIKAVDTISDPVVAMFTLGYARNAQPALLDKAVNNLVKRFPDHKGVAGLAADYNRLVASKRQQEESPAPTGKTPEAGSAAPDFTMADTSGKKISLSDFKGKYVLVDFWASWCAPCRGENPNVVAAFQQYHSKNFTVLGVSLDEDKLAWLKAIKDDKLNWTQVSDLKGWANATVALYGYEGIPFNVLVDPSGRIIAKELRGEALQQKLAEVLK